MREKGRGIEDCRRRINNSMQAGLAHLRTGIIDTECCVSSAAVGRPTGYRARGEEEKKDKRNAPSRANKPVDAGKHTRVSKDDAGSAEEMPVKQDSVVAQIWRCEGEIWGGEEAEARRMGAEAWVDGERDRGCRDWRDFGTGGGGEKFPGWAPVEMERRAGVDGRERVDLQVAGWLVPWWWSAAYDALAPRGLLDWAGAPPLRSSTVHSRLRARWPSWWRETPCRGTAAAERSNVRLAQQARRRQSSHCAVTARWRDVDQTCSATRSGLQACALGTVHSSERLPWVRHRLVCCVGSCRAV